MGSAGQETSRVGAWLPRSVHGAAPSSNRGGWGDRRISGRMRAGAHRSSTTAARPLTSARASARPAPPRRLGRPKLPPLTRPQAVDPLLEGDALAAMLRGPKVEVRAPDQHAPADSKVRQRTHRVIDQVAELPDADRAVARQALQGQVRVELGGQGDALDHLDAVEAQLRPQGAALPGRGPCTGRPRRARRVGAMRPFLRALG